MRFLIVVFLAMSTAAFGYSDRKAPHRVFYDNPDAYRFEAALLYYENTYMDSNYRGCGSVSDDHDQHHAIIQKMLGLEGDACPYDHLVKLMKKDTWSYPVESFDSDFDKGFHPVGHWKLSGAWHLYLPEIELSFKETYLAPFYEIKILEDGVVQYHRDNKWHDVTDRADELPALADQYRVFNSMDKYYKVNAYRLDYWAQFFGDKRVDKYTEANKGFFGMGPPAWLRPLKCVDRVEVSLSPYPDHNYYGPGILEKEIYEGLDWVRPRENCMIIRDAPILGPDGRFIHVDLFYEKVQIS